MSRDDERLLWILGLLLLLWFVFRRAGFQFSGGVGPVGVSFGVGTSGFTGGSRGSMTDCCGGCGWGDTSSAQGAGDVGNYAQG